MTSNKQEFKIPIAKFVMIVMILALTVLFASWVFYGLQCSEKLQESRQETVVFFITADFFLLLLLGSISWKLLGSNTQRKNAEKELIRLNEELGEKVRERTQNLSKANEALRNEVQKHQEALIEKNEIEAQLRHAQKMEAIGTLAGGVAHDFNNILTPILGNAELASIQLDKDHPLQLELSEIIAASKRAKELIQQILMFSRRNEKELMPLKVELVVKEAVQLLRHAIPESIDIQTDIEKNCGEVNASPTQIHQVIMNLCTNAYQAMEPDGGKLTITQKKTEVSPNDFRCRTNLEAGPYIRIDISDTGDGIPEEIRERIFEPYFTTKEVGKGSGLGLSVVHAIVQDLHGHIEFSSTPDKGTSFVIFLPITQTESTEDSNASATPAGSEHILIVDDQKSVVQMEQRMLDSLGYKTTAVTSPAQGLEFIRSNAGSIDLLLTDMAMPNMNGLKLIEQAQAYAPDLKIIICSGFMEDMNRETAQAFGIKGFLRKPVSIHELSTIIRNVLDGKSG